MFYLFSYIRLPPGFTQSIQAVLPGSASVPIKLFNNLVFAAIKKLEKFTKKCLHNYSD